MDWPPGQPETEQWLPWDLMPGIGASPVYRIFAALESLAELQKDHVRLRGLCRIISSIVLTAQKGPLSIKVKNQRR